MKKAMAMICLVCLLLSCLSGCGEKPQETVTAGTYISIKKVEEKLAIIYNDTLIVTEYDHEYDYQLTLSRNGDYGLCKTSEGALLYIHDGEVMKLTDQVYTYQMNAAGTTVLYQKEEGGSLQLYQKATGKTEVISDGIIHDCALSPDGQTVAYLTSTSIGLIVQKVGQEKKELALESLRGYRLISINNQADLLYLLVDNKVVSMDGEGKTTLVRTNVTEKRFYSNEDHTQLMFYSNGIGTCLSTQGQVSVTLTERWLQPIEPTGVHFATNGVEPEQQPFVFGVSQITCHVPDLSGYLLGEQQSYLGGSGYSFWLPNAEGVYTLIAESQIFNSQQSSYYLDPQGRFLYYSRRGDQSAGDYYVNLETGAAPILLVDEASSFAVCRDGTGVYSIYDGLFFHSTAEGAQPQRLVDTDGGASCYVSENNRVYISKFVGTKYALFALNEEGTKVELLLENVDSVVQEDCGMIYILAGEDHYVIRAGELIKLQIKT